MKSLLRFEIDRYGVAFDTAPLYFFLNWSGLALALAVVLALKLRKTIKTKKSKK